jgi:hypothetical protein
MPLALAAATASAADSLEWLERVLRSHLDDTTTLLKIANYADYHTAAVAAFQDSILAIRSCWTLMQLMWTPVLLALYYVVTISANKLYRHVLIHVGSSSVAQLKIGAVKVYQFQLSLTPEQWAMEVAVLLVLTGLYQLRRYIQKQAMVQRVMHFYRRQQSQVQKVRGSLLFVLYFLDGLLNCLDGSPWWM